MWISGYWEKCLEEVGLGKNRNRNSELVENGKGKENDEMRLDEMSGIWEYRV